MHLVFCALSEVGLLHGEILKLDSEDMRVIVAITVFFEVFYTRQCYQRCVMLWSLTNVSFSAAYDIAFIMRLFVQKSGRRYDRVAFRWVVVTLLLSLVEARKKENITRSDLLLMVEMGLVKPGEVAFLQDVTGQQRMLIMLHAAASVGRIGASKSDAPPDAPKNFCTSLMSFRAAQQEMQDLLLFPVPFGYVHLLSVMVCICLAAQAYSLALQGSIFSPFFYSLNSVVLIGMMDLATRLSDPLGDDDSDFPLSKWIETFLSNVACVIDYEHDGTLDDFVHEMQDEEQAPTQFKVSRLHVEDMLGHVPAEE